MLSNFRRSTLNNFLSVSSRLFSHHHQAVVGFIGLGHMGSKMVKNLADDGHSVLVFDQSDKAIKSVLKENKEKQVQQSTVESIAQNAQIIFSMLPNDAVVEGVSKTILEASKTQNADNRKIHVSCSTISPEVAKKLTKEHLDNHFHFVSAPVFARPDGISRREAIFMLSGNKDAKITASKYLSLLGRVEDFGEDCGAANVVKLCGNFLIAASIEAISESMALAEKNGVDRQKVMQLLSSTIFDCLIYKGYGQRVSQRDHKPGGFSLELGYKDVSLVSKAARDANVPMPFVSTLVDRYLCAKAKGRENLDWSAIGLNVAEDAGIDINSDLQKNMDILKNQ